MRRRSNVICGKCAGDFVDKRITEISEFIRVPKADICIIITSAHRDTPMGKFEYGVASDVRSGFRMGDLYQEEHSCGKAND